MRRFLISSKNYTGTIELVYDSREQLVTVDFTNGDLNLNQVEMFTRIIPAHIDRMAEVFGRYPQLTVAEADFDVTFLQFWSKYKKKINKARAEKLWDALKLPEQLSAYYGIAAYDKFLAKESWRTKADPETYLRNKYWQNEY